MSLAQAAASAARAGVGRAGEWEDHYICFPAEQSSDPACKSDIQKHAAQARSDLFFKATVCVSVSFLSR